jgi:dihydrofolate reductase
MVRKIVCYTLMSLDGDVDDPSLYFPSQGQPEERAGFDDVLEANEAKITSTQDAVLLGRRMYDEWSRYWPNVSDHPFAPFINNVEKYVVTSTPLTRQWHNSRPVSVPVEQFVRELKAGPGGDIGLHGSIDLARSLIKAGLVDELQLVVGPTFGFNGRRLFPTIAGGRALHLASAASSPSGSLMLCYHTRREVIRFPAVGT